MADSSDQILALYASIGRDPSTVTPDEVAYWQSSGASGDALANQFLSAAATYATNADPSLAAAGQAAAALLTTDASAAQSASLPSAQPSPAPPPMSAPVVASPSLTAQVQSLYQLIGRDPSTVPASEIAYWTSQGLTGDALGKAFLTAAVQYVNDPTLSAYAKTAASVLGVTIAPSPTPSPTPSPIVKVTTGLTPTPAPVIRLSTTGAVISPAPAPGAAGDAAVGASAPSNALLYGALAIGALLLLK